MSGELIAFGLGLEHTEKRLINQLLAMMLGILICTSAEAGILSGILGDGCFRDEYKVGQVLPVTLNIEDAYDDKYERMSVKEALESTKEHKPNGVFKVKDANWGTGGKNKMSVKDMPIERLNRVHEYIEQKRLIDRANGMNYERAGKFPQFNFSAKVVQLDGGGKVCWVDASFIEFDSADELIIAQTEEKGKALKAEAEKKDNAERAAQDQKRAAYDQCVAELDFISTASGSDKELKGWRARCEAIIFASEDPKGSSQKYDTKLEEIRKVRTKLILAGKLKIESYDDAKLVNTPLILETIAFNPLLKADGKIYANKFWLTLEAEEGANLLRAVAIDPKGQKPYVFLRTTKNTTIFGSGGMRVGGIISVMGRYTDNIKYTTVMGVTKSAPTLEVMYLDAGALR